jgi:RimJ/RimL family protein N-acetyltransferase
VNDRLARRLVGGIVVLEPLTPEHEPGLWQAASDQRIWDYFPVLAASDRRTFRAWIAEALDAGAAGVAVPFATVLAAAGEPIGSTRFQNIRPEHGVVEIGATWLHRQSWGTGANTEAKLLQLTYAFDSLQARRVEFKTEATNRHSRAALTALGATFEGVARKHMLVRNGQSRDSAWYSILGDEWQATKAELEKRPRRRSAP